MRVGCTFDATVPCHCFGLLVLGCEEGIALFRCLRRAALGTRHLTWTGRSHLILVRATTAAVQKLRVTNVELLNGGESKDVEKVLPVTVWHTGGTLGFDRTDGRNELSEIPDCCAGVVLIEPAKSPRCRRT